MSLPLPSPASLLKGSILLGLCVLAVIEIAGDEAPGAAPKPVHPAAYASADASAPRFESGEKWSELALARPLFNPDRRPFSSAPASEPVTEAALPRLAGTIIGGAARAIFQPEDAKPLVVSVGDIVGEWTVAAISVGSVTLKKGDTAMSVAAQRADHSSQIVAVASGDAAGMPARP